MPHEIDDQELRRLLGEATPGPWDIAGHAGSIGHTIYAAGIGSIFCDSLHHHHPHLFSHRTVANAKLVALAPTLAAKYLDLRERVEWRPIETAPKDGAPFFASASKEVFIARWSLLAEGWFNVNCLPCKPTHWMPLPAPTDED